MKDRVREIVAMSEKSRTDGNQNWGRHAGTVYDRMTREWVVAQFKAIGLENVRDQPVTQEPRWWPESWDASLVVDGKVTPLTDRVRAGRRVDACGGRRASHRLGRAGAPPPISAAGTCAGRRC
jgi:hypothetical protein